MNANDQAAMGNSTAGSAGLAPQTLTGVGFNGTIPNAGSTIPNSGVTTWTTTSIHVGDPLTKEEQVELDELRTQHVLDIRLAKIAGFKKLPAELRQFVVNMLTWNEEVDRLEAVSADKSQRQIELEQKESNNGFLTIQNGTAWLGNNAVTNATIRIPDDFRVPDGLTVDELKQAHMESTLEEQMLEND